MKALNTVFLLVIAVVFVFTGCIEQVTNYETYTSSALGISFEYPGDWNISEAGSVIYAMSALGPTLVIQAIPNMGQSLDGAADTIKLAYATMPDYQEISNMQAVLGNMHARESIIKASQDDIPFMAGMLVAGGTNSFYAITYVAPEPLYGAYEWAYIHVKETFAVTDTSYVCGNGVCETDLGESYVNCLEDCEITYVCGNDVCESVLGEDAQNCPGDCSGNGGEIIEYYTATTIIPAAGTPTWDYLYVAGEQSVHALTLDDNTQTIWLKWKSGTNDGDVATEWDSIDVANLEFKTVQPGCYLLGCTGTPSCDAYVTHLSTMNWDPSITCPV